MEFSLFPITPDDYNFLYIQLQERDETCSISHKHIPTWEDHVKFIESCPYQVWYVIVVEGVKVGHCYISQNNEIGIFLLKSQQGKGYGKEVVKTLASRWPCKLIANINPKNERSIKLFESLGFKHIQNTYKR